MEGFEAKSTYLLLLAGARAVSFNPLINGSLAKKQWEAYAKSNGHKLDSYSLVLSTPGTWPADKGIYRKTATGAKIFDNTFDSNSAYPWVKVPIWQIAPIMSNVKAVMYNLHSETFRAAALDAAIKAKQPAMTDVIQLVQDSFPRPSSIIFAPVISALDKSQNILGFTSIGMLVSHVNYYSYHIMSFLSCNKEQWQYHIKLR